MRVNYLFSNKKISLICSDITENDTKITSDEPHTEPPKNRSSEKSQCGKPSEGKSCASDAGKAQQVPRLRDERERQRQLDAEEFELAKRKAEAEACEALQRRFNKEDKQREQKERKRLKEQEERLAQEKRKKQEELRRLELQERKLQAKIQREREREEQQRREKEAQLEAQRLAEERRAKEEQEQRDRAVDGKEMRKGNAAAKDARRGKGKEREKRKSMPEEPPKKSAAEAPPASPAPLKKRESYKEILTETGLRILKPETVGKPRANSLAPAPSVQPNGETHSVSRGQQGSRSPTELSPDVEGAHCLGTNGEPRSGKRGTGTQPQGAGAPAFVRHDPPELALSSVISDDGAPKRRAAPFQHGELAFADPFPLTSAGTVGTSSTRLPSLSLPSPFEKEFSPLAPSIFGDGDYSLPAHFPSHRTQGLSVVDQLFGDGSTQSPLMDEQAMHDVGGAQPWNVPFSFFPVNFDFSFQNHQNVSRHSPLVLFFLSFPLSFSLSFLFFFSFFSFFQHG